MNDKIEFAIIRSDGNERLCYKSGTAFVDVNMPMQAFTEGEDVFEVTPPDFSYRTRTYEYRGRQVRVEPCFYENGWLAICVVNPADEEDHEILTVNLEQMDAIGLPARTFVDCNNQPEALEFLTKNKFATASGYKRTSGFVAYPMVNVDLVRLYQHKPEAFQNANIL